MQYLQFTNIPKILESEISLPASKSISNRVLIIRALAGDFQISNLSDANDTKLLTEALASDQKEIFIGNAGTAMRFLTAFYALGNKEKILNGDSQMNQRPIFPLVNALRQLGAKIEYIGQENYPPIKILPSKLTGTEISIDSGISSQFISALMMIAPVLENGLVINLDEVPTSLPYLQLTASTMRYFSADTKIEDKKITISPYKYIAKNLSVESDWSSASYFYALTAILKKSKIEMNSLYNDSLQGDVIIEKLMQSFGVISSFQNNGVKINSDGNYPAFFSADMINYPDLIPTMVCLCIALDIPFKITGTRTLKFKETDRQLAMKTELKKLGINLVLDDDSVAFDGSNFNTDMDVILETYNDHRMVMSFVLLTMRFRNIRIENPMTVKKSFPGFFDELKKGGFQFNISEHAD